jgi:hypothetical protein
MAMNSLVVARCFESRQGLASWACSLFVLIDVDGVLDMVPFYIEGGFRLAHRDLRFEGLAHDQADPDVRATTANDFAAIVALDADLLGTTRPEFLRAWLKAPGAHAVVLCSESRHIVALGVMRPALVR